ncbi:hypothetical protein VD0002_g9946 [Verticillium dahliae]|uniref:Uncharacterized protein n=1 Tax=Verticillium dahliae TaxID=27337 RepID=A0AA44WCK1_VERDA|nr:Putative iron/ascorbate oxidoreductase [Verticillium dahliae VDG2]KAH6703452.1 hypothetical protein EV126DRAFT_337083 [Verticillium dahliae]PNH29144.1 hypothetical protein BJF96_g7488 [Verticillium dahliae]PNH51191.1 hypothetical protein VD0003_g6046 [Verticillium dahliae]PNH54951.1 hypothetical protein VD0002_g9946 [Verticillium dahliae]
MALAHEIGSLLQTLPRGRRLLVSEEDPVNAYFDLAAYYGDGSDDAGSRSESSSVLTPGPAYDTATSPSVISDSYDMDIDPEEPHQQQAVVQGTTQKTLADARRHDGHLIWPQADPSQDLPRHSTLSLSGRKKRSRRPSSPAARHVKNPAETARVRKLGACIKCRIEKLKCSDETVCVSCQGKYGVPLCQRTCLRKTLSDLAKHTTFVRYTGLRYNQEQALLRTKCAPGEGFREVFLSFSDIDLQSPTLKTVFRKCHSLSNGAEVIAFPRDRVPLHSQLVEWVEHQILAERHAGRHYGFEATIDTFILKYIKAGTSRTALPQIRLIRKIHEMRCMYRIWRVDTLYWRHAQTSHHSPLPPFIHAELRQIVKSALESCERDIFNELDKFLKPSGIPAKDRAPMWAALWQLIFTFKDLTQTFKEAGRLANVHPAFDACTAATEQLYVAIMSFYGSHYRQASNLKVSIQCLDSTHMPSSTLRHEVGDIFQHARHERGAFHEYIQTSPNELDRLLKTLVVDLEVKRLGNRRGRGRAPVEMVLIPSPDLYPGSDDEDDMEMAG